MDRNMKNNNCYGLSVRFIINKNIILVCTMAVFLFGLSFWCWLKEENSFSESERRVLKSAPDFTWEQVINGNFMKDFEEYTLDQFPVRDRFRSVKAVASLAFFQNRDNNGIYLAEGYLSKVEYPLQEKMLEYAAKKMQYIYDTYLTEDGGKVYLAIVPDKNYFLARENGYLALDYDRLFYYMQERMSYMEYIDIVPLLSLEDYYRTDTHWRQECITDVAQYLGEKMGISLEESYEKLELEVPFYGVYCGQSALPVQPDTLYYLNNKILENCKVTSYDTGSPEDTVIYNMEKAMGKDAYEIFLSGANALSVIENPMAEEKNELIIFRDSFGSSLIPLLIEGYSKITVIDIRYVNSSMLKDLVDFEGQDTLFIYSTLILNNSTALK